MNIEEFRAYCLSLPGTTEGMKWEHLCFMIEEKLFVIIDLDNEHSFSTKCTTEEFEELTARDGIKQAHHMAKKHWVMIANLEVLNDADLKKRVETSRALVLAKLPKKIQEKYK